VTFALARSLLIADAVTAEALGRALFLAATRRVSIVRALLATNAVDPARLEEHLEHVDAPAMRHIVPVAGLVHALPPGMCERLMAVPVRRDPRTGTVDVAVVDARDPHAADEIAYWLRAPVRVVRTSITSMDSALRRLEAPPEPEMRPLAAPMGLPSPAGLRGSRPAEEIMSGPNIPIPLTRRSLLPASPGEVGPPAIEKDAASAGRPGDREPVLDLKRRRADAPASHQPVPEAPSTRRGPFGPPAVAPAPEPVTAITEKMQLAQHRDRVLELLVSGVEAVAKSVVVLAIRRDAITGWTASAGIGAGLRDLRMPTSVRTVLDEGLDHAGIRLVRMPDDAVHAPLMTLLGIRPGSAVAVGAVRVEGKPAAVVVAAELVENLRAMSRMADLTPAAGDALARLLRERRK